MANLLEHVLMAKRYLNSRGKEDVSMFNGETLLWKINKLYTSDNIRDDETSVGMPVDIYVESIGNTTKEWL